MDDHELDVSVKGEKSTVFQTWW